jgi:cell division protein FtsI (penicillin-binding protein 3)
VRRPPVGRLIALLAVMLFALTGVMARLSVLQLREGSSYEEQGYTQRLRTFTLPAQRGSILDASRQPLAISVEARDIYVDPTFVEDAEAEAARIAPVLGMRVTPMRRALSSQGTFAWVDRQVDLSTAECIRAMQLPGIGFLPVAKRSYPGGSLAAQVLGSVNIDGVGSAGLEYQYEPMLEGTPG